MIKQVKGTGHDKRISIRTLLVHGVVLTAVACSSTEPKQAGTRGAAPGRITALAPTIWACPLENWRLGRDDGCDPVPTGTRVTILQRGARPEYPHGPFALVEYEHRGATKAQWVINNTVTPLGEDEPTVEDIVKDAIRPTQR